MASNNSCILLTQLKFSIKLLLPLPLTLALLLYKKLFSYQCVRASICICAYKLKASSIGGDINCPRRGFKEQICCYHGLCYFNAVKTYVAATTSKIKFVSLEFANACTYNTNACYCTCTALDTKFIMKTLVTFKVVLPNYMRKSWKPFTDFKFSQTFEKKFFLGYYFY